MNMMILSLSALLVSGCGVWPLQQEAEASDLGPTEVSENIVRPVARPEQSVQSIAAGAKPRKSTLGTTVVSLGTPSEAGLWLKTPLVRAPAIGLVSHKGKTIEVQLLPIEGELSAGSRISLHAMQALGIPLTDLTEVKVSAI